MEDKVKVFASIIDEATKEQVKKLSESEAYKNCTIRIMPDCHAGKGCTIGSVIQYQDRIVPNTVGVDIGCGMLVIELGNITIDFQKLDGVIHNYIPSGFDIHETPVVNYDSAFIASIKDRKYIECSIGTLGGGNHFIEVDEDDEHNKYLVIHSGSRNLGVQVCEYWQEVAVKELTDDSEVRKALIDRLKAEGREKEINEELKKIKKPFVNKELAYLEGDNLEKYIHDMGACQIYATMNRIIMANIITHHMHWNSKDKFATIHNYVDIPNKIIRKGAIKADKGEKVIIPINMRDGSLICIGKGNSEWLNSAPHGAGRIMSRNQAIENLKLEDYIDSMNGIYTTSVCDSTIDEAPMVYKPIEKIMSDITDTVEVVKVIKPIYNFKAKQ